MGAMLAAYLGLARALAPLAPAVLARRAARGREIPARLPEKLGRPSRPRPPGRLVWLHAVGLGEVLALRGLIAAMAQAAPDLSFLVTSTARSSAEVFARNCPPRTLHQFLPLDAPRFVRPFLDHWRPDLSVWAEQDLWPGAVVETARRGIPLAFVNARMSDAARARRARAGGLYRDVLDRFAWLAAQDARSAANLAALARRPVETHPSLKLAAPPLAADPAALAALRGALGDRPVWLCGPSHPQDEALALAAHRLRLAACPEALLILAPRLPARGPQIDTGGLVTARRSEGALPAAATQVYVADSFGEMGLWYRVARAALIGGTCSAVEGHNPWEAARLGAAVLHGPHTANFRADFAALEAAAAARMTGEAEELAAALAEDLAPMAARAAALCAAQEAALAGLAARLLGLMRR